MKSPRKSSKTKRAPKAPEIKNGDLNAILPYEEPAKALNLENLIHEEAEQNSKNSNQTNEVLEIKPKKLSGKY